MNHLKSLLLKLTAIAVVLSAGLVLSSATELQAREVDTEHKVVPKRSIPGDTLKLVGTAVTGIPGQSVAVIEDPKSRRQWSFHEGDQAGDILIKSIRRDHIVIDAGNGEKTVKLRGFLAGYENTTIKSAAGRGRVTVPVNRIGSRERQVVIDRQTALTTLADPQAALEEVKIMPARYFNRKTGFRIADFGANSIFSKMGLRSGDLVLAIDDREITGPEDAAGVLRRVREDGDVDLTVRRRARTYHINLLIQ